MLTLFFLKQKSYLSKYKYKCNSFTFTNKTILQNKVPSNAEWFLRFFLFSIMVKTKNTIAKEILKRIFIYEFLFTDEWTNKFGERQNIFLNFFSSLKVHWWLLFKVWSRKKNILSFIKTQIKNAIVILISILKYYFSSEN